MRGSPPATNVVDDQGWLAAARRGERWALERLYTDHHASVYALCHRLLGRTEDAEDAMQAAFVQAFNALSRFEGRSSIRTWLFRIAYNVSIQALRHRGTTPIPLDGDTPVGDGAPAATERIAVRGALTRLRPDHQAILVLRFWEGLSYEEMASVLNVPMPTVKMRLSRAKREFRRWYEGDL